MLTKNLTPFLFAARGTSLRPPKPTMSVVVRATYAIADDGALTPVGSAEARPLSAETYRDDDDDRSGGALSPSDFADYKTRAEVLVTGSCHAPKGEPVAECAVRVQVGAWSKTLRVTGRRVWGGTPTPFVSLPIDWEHAYGGPSFAANPSGRGFDSDVMPSVTHGKDVLRARGDTSLEPASFGPINPRWPQRARKLGEDYGESYRKTRAPYFAGDMDPTFFLESTPDQWLAGYLQGDEAVVVNNLHPRVPTLVTKLPGQRARVFYREDTKGFHEMVLHLDTLHLDLQRCRLELSWRGVVDVREEDLDDVTMLLVASEALVEPKKPLAHYEALASAHEADPVGASVLPRASSEAERPHEISARLEQSLGPALPDSVRELTPVLEQALALAASRDARVEPALQERSQEARSQQREAPPARVSRPGARPHLGIRRHVRETIAKATEARTRALEKGATPEQLGELMTVEALAHDPRWVELEPSYTPPEPLSTDPPGPGANLVDRDLREMDLRGVDLSGANLEGALLTGARLGGAALRGARLFGAVLYRADLSSADLTDADLSLANAAFASLRGAKLDRAKLSEAFFEDADLESASLVGAEGAFAIFTRSKLAHADLQGAKLPSAELDDADLSAARLDGAEIPRGRFNRSRCAGANFSGALLERASFEESLLDDARFFDVKADGVVLASATAKRAIFAFARMRNAFANRLNALGADFHGADLRDARMHRVNLSGAKLTSANLFGADLWKSRLDAAKLTKSNLYQAKLLHVDLKTCDLSGANLKKCILEGT